MEENFSREANSHSVKFLLLVEPEGSLPCPKLPAYYYKYSINIIK